MLLLYGIFSGVHVILTDGKVLARSMTLLLMRGPALPYSKWSLPLLEALKMKLIGEEHQIPIFSAFLRHISMSP